MQQTVTDITLVTPTKTNNRTPEHVTKVENPLARRGLTLRVS